MQQTSPVRAKLTRPRLHRAVPRERLFDKLDSAHLQRPGICVVGPPGAGKTTLVASWSDARRVKGIWYQVDAGDADLATFFFYLGEAARPFVRKGRRPLPAADAGVSARHPRFCAAVLPGSLRPAAGRWELFGMPEGYSTDLAVQVRAPADMDAVVREIPARQPDARVTRRDDVLRTYDGLFDWRGGILAAILAFSALAFLVLIWDKASGLPPEERGDIGVLRAIGWEASDVLLLKVCEGAVVSIPAFLCGTLLAYAHVFPGKAFLITPVLKEWSTLYPDFLLTPSVGVGRIALLFGLTVVPYSAVAAVAARWAIAADPDAAMR